MDVILQLGVQTKFSLIVWEWQHNIHSFTASAAAVCFLSPLCTDLMICHSARLWCLIQVSCNLTLLFSRPVRNPLIGLLFKANKCVIWSQGHGVTGVSSVCFGAVLRFGRGSTRPDTQPDVTSAPGCDTADTVRNVALSPICFSSCTKDWAQASVVLSCAAWFVHHSYMHAYLNMQMHILFFWQSQWALRYRSWAESVLTLHEMLHTSVKSSCSWCFFANTLESLCGKWVLGSWRLRWSPCEDDNWGPAVSCQTSNTVVLNSKKAQWNV